MHSFKAGDKVKPTYLAIKNGIIGENYRGVVVRLTNHPDKIVVQKDGTKYVETYHIKWWELAE